MRLLRRRHGHLLREQNISLRYDFREKERDSQRVMWNKLTVEVILAIIDRERFASLLNRFPEKRELPISSIDRSLSNAIDQRWTDDCRRHL